MEIKTKANPFISTKDRHGDVNGYLVPIYNINEGFLNSNESPQQVYLTVVAPGAVKGPHLHYIRTGHFTCIKGNVRFILKTSSGYQVIFSGEDYQYLTLIVPTGVPAAIQNVGGQPAFILNMPYPAWTPQMNDEHQADFCDFDFTAGL
jgi:oxalate decarboxylase/phosphoglucose isomerase-like protein (cupin superfamily)